MRNLYWWSLGSLYLCCPPPTHTTGPSLLVVMNYWPSGSALVVIFWFCSHSLGGTLVWRVVCASDLFGVLRVLPQLFFVKDMGLRALLEYHYHIFSYCYFLLLAFSLRLRLVAYTTLSIRPTRGCTKETTMNGI